MLSKIADYISYGENNELENKNQIEFEILKEKYYIVESQEDNNTKLTIILNHI